jgi:cytochrome P450
VSNGHPSPTSTPRRLITSFRPSPPKLEDLELDPHQILAELREREPVAWVPALNGWIVTRRDLALAAMRDPATFTVDDPRFSTGRVVGPSMLTLDGTEHDRHRAPFARAFRRAEVRQQLAQLVADETDRLIDALESAGHGDLSSAFAAPLAASVVTHALGLPNDHVRDWYRAIVHATTEVTRGGEVTSAAQAAVEELRAAVRASAMTADGLTPDELASNVATLMFGGIETTEGMIANALLHLLEHPDQLALVLADRTLTPNAIEESLRLEPAAATIDRYATRDTELGAAKIRKGDLVTISIAAANRDPATFTYPDRFDITRTNAKQHLAFAHGPHVCIGMHLARLEAHTAVNRVLERLPNLRLDPAKPAAKPRGLVFRKPEALHVTWR